MSNGTKLSQKLPWNFPIYLFGVVIFVFGCFPALITEYYLPYCFKPLSLFLRSISGKFEIAIGEWLYLLIIISLIIKLIQNLWRNQALLTLPRFWLFQTVGLMNGLMKLYILFQLCWGFNYQKFSPAADFNLNVPKKYTEAQMDSLSLDLISKLNHSRALLTDSQLKVLQFEELATQTMAQYDQAELKYPFLQYRRPVLKKAVFGNWGDYFGYTAFYQPLTGEAIVRSDLPILTQPFTISHEIAHQLGYASEGEANFIAYVIGVESKSPLFNYSAELQLFSYAQIAHLNSIAKRGDFKLFENTIARNKKLLDPKVIADRKAIRLFFERKQDLQIPGSAAFYDQFLQWNKQANGVESYNDVLLWALAFKTYSSTSCSQ
jgi:hypothetical protein